MIADLTRRRGPVANHEPSADGGANRRDPDLADRRAVDRRRLTRMHAVAEQGEVAAWSVATQGTEHSPRRLMTTHRPVLPQEAVS
jgi:hypothetical protein